MPKYQLPPLKDEKQFEEFVCELFNIIENTNSYDNTDFQIFGVKGQNQKGIDILSTTNQTVIQCKLKDIRGKDNIIRQNLINDINDTLDKVLDLNFTFNRLIIASTFRDDAPLQEYVNQIKQEKEHKFNIYYYGWDTLSKHAELHESILKKYFPQFKIKKPKQIIELPEGALGKDLYKKNYVTYLIKKYGDWKQIELDKTAEKFNWASINKHLMNKYKAAGINFIPVVYFNDLVVYLQDRINKTAFGRNRKAKGVKNYSSFEEHISGLVE